VSEPHARHRSSVPHQPRSSLAGETETPAHEGPRSLGEPSSEAVASGSRASPRFGPCLVPHGTGCPEIRLSSAVERSRLPASAETRNSSSRFDEVRHEIEARRSRFLLVFVSLDRPRSTTWALASMAHFEVADQQQLHRSVSRVSRVDLLRETVRARRRKLDSGR
jgi:hypothetical protein